MWLRLGRWSLGTGFRDIRSARPKQNTIGNRNGNMDRLAGTTMSEVRTPSRDLNGFLRDSSVISPHSKHREPNGHPVLPGDASHNPITTDWFRQPTEPPARRRKW